MYNNGNIYVVSPQSPSSLPPPPTPAYIQLKRSLVIFKVKTITSCLSWNTNQCVRDGPSTGRIVYQMQKRNNWNNICYSLVARRTSLNISTELVVHTNNWESRHNCLALKKVNSRGLLISFALFPELINNEHTEYFTGIQREYFKWLHRRLRPSANAWRASYDS